MSCLELSNGTREEEDVEGNDTTWDSDNGDCTEASEEYLTPELNERHMVLDRRRLHKQRRIPELMDRRGLSKNSSRSLSTDDEECFFTIAEEAPPRVRFVKYDIILLSAGRLYKAYIVNSNGLTGVVMNKLSN